MFTIERSEWNIFLVSAGRASLLDPFLKFLLLNKHELRARRIFELHTNIEHNSDGAAFAFPGSAMAMPPCLLFLIAPVSDRFGDREHDSEIWFPSFGHSSSPFQRW